MMMGIPDTSRYRQPRPAIGRQLLQMPRLPPPYGGSEPWYAPGGFGPPGRYGTPGFQPNYGLPVERPRPGMFDQPGMMPQGRPNPLGYGGFYGGTPFTPGPMGQRRPGLAMPRLMPPNTIPQRAYRPPQEFGGFGMI